MHRPFIAATLLLLSASLILAGCGRDRSEATDPPIAIRTPLPTFTPTPQPGSVTGGAADSSAAAPAAPIQTPPAQDSLAQTQSEPAETRGIGGPVAPLEERADVVATAPPAVAPAAAPVVAAPLAVINTELVNARRGPDTTYDVVVILGRGEEFDVTGKSDDGAWFRICCTIEGAEAWVKAEFLDTDGATDPLPVAQAGDVSGNALATLTATAAPVQIAAAATEAPTATPQPIAAAQPEPTATPAPAAPAPAPAASAPAAAPAPATESDAAVAAADASASLQLVAQEQFPETNVVRVFLYAYSENEALEGYSLRVTKDGVELAAGGQSFGGRPGLTWPIADDRQRFQNLKVEFPGVDPAGTWSIVPVKDGAPAGPAATYTLAGGEPNRELYVRYKRP